MAPNNIKSSRQLDSGSCGICYLKGWWQKKATQGAAVQETDASLLQCRGDGYQFDHAAFVRSRGGSDKAQEFLRQFRHSQLFEVFINERLKLASQGYKTQDTFESKVMRLSPSASLRHLPRAPARPPA